MTILCQVDEPTAIALAQAVAGERIVPVTSLSAAGVAVSADPGERLVVVGTDVELNDVLVFAGHMRYDHPAVAIVLFRTTFDAVALEAAQNAGVHEVLTPSDVNALIARIQHGMEQAGDSPAPEPPPAEHAQLPRGRLITVFAAKGGSGKTTVSTNLATVLNDGGAHSVCLVDLDLEFGDVAVSLQLTPASTLIDAIDAGHLDAINVSGLLTPYRPGFNCVLAPIEPGDAEKIPARLVSQLLESLLATHEFVVVDTASQLSEHVLAAMDMTHHFVLLTTPEIPGLKNLRLTLDMLDLLSYDPNARIIVFNRADARSGLSAAEVEGAIRTRIGVRVPSSHDIPASINRGVPLALTHPKHPVSLAIKELAQGFITGRPNSASSRRSNKRRSKLRMRSS